jgi:uncharacterized protein YeaO (DUF488 family)
MSGPWRMDSGDLVTGRWSKTSRRRERWESVTRRDVRLRRIYDAPAEDDGYRVLVDRIWPRGVSKSTADLDEWCAAVAPSGGLRTWYGHTPAKFDEFRSRYRKELDDPQRAEALRHLRVLASKNRLTLLTATKQVEISQAAVIAELLRGPTGTNPTRG